MQQNHIWVCVKEKFTQKNGRIHPSNVGLYLYIAWYKNCMVCKQQYKLPDAHIFIYK